MSEDMDHPPSSGNNSGKEIWVTHFNEDSALKFRDQVMERAEKEGSMVIPIYIDSYGGNADALAMMLATMDEVPNRFVTVCMGKAISCGSILLSHGDLRFCDKYSRVMVHNVSTISWGDVYSLKSTSEEAMRMNKVFMGLLAANCNMSYEALQQKIKDSVDSKEIWMSPGDALKFGIVDEIGVPEIVPVVQWACDVRPEKVRLDLHQHPVKAKKKPTAAAAAKKRKNK